MIHSVVKTSTLKDALTLVSTNLPLFHIHQTFRVSPWLKVNGKLRDYHLALTSHLGGALHLLSLDRLLGPGTSFLQGRLNVSTYTSQGFAEMEGCT